MTEDPTAQDWASFGLEAGASLEELQRAYRRRRALYEAATLATYSLYTEEERLRLVEALEQAYRRLLATFPPSPAATGAPPADATPPPTGLTSTPAGYLRRLRELRGLSLADIAQRTKIRPAILAALEAEDVALLPAPVYVRGFVLQIAKLLGAPDPEALARR
ncbi:MAG: helix-turn-helix domain-containing protein, partial [Thermoanaerobaculaceae bacterium]|nr:helix-turn-helix domain-containing protein [Thermoanaerobaculaceae bacterium]